MKEKYLVDNLLTQAINDVPKKRSCLCCNLVFESESFGNRICSRCKSTTAWRNGIPPVPGASRRR